MKIQLVEFGKIKRGKYFRYNNQIWKRTRGRFAIRECDIGSGSVGWPFDLKIKVEQIFNL